MNKYVEMRERHNQEITDFPMFFAFSKEQLAEGMRRIGLHPDDSGQIFHIGAGGFCRKSDKPLLSEMFDRHETEIAEAIAADDNGDGFVFDMFNTELANHEYVYTHDVSDTLRALGYSAKSIAKDDKLKYGLIKAIKAQLNTDIDEDE